jgi:seryl-tRNA synthetase
MTKKTDWEPFSGVVCERLRRLRDKAARARSQRDKLFKARDAVDAALNEIGKDEAKKRDRLLSEYGETVRKIKDLDHKIRDFDKSIDETIQHADQAELFDDPDTFTPPADPDEEGGQVGEGAKEPEGASEN